MLINVNKNYLRNLFIVILVLIGLHQAAHAQANYLKITSYKVYYGWAAHYPQDCLIIRSFVNDGKNYVLMVDPQTLVTKVDEPGLYRVRPKTQLSLSAEGKLSINIWSGQ